MELHFKCLQGFMWFSLQYLWNRAVRITEKPYTPQRERLCMLWGNPVIFTDCGGNPIVIHNTNKQTTCSKPNSENIIMNWKNCD